MRQSISRIALMWLCQALAMSTVQAEIALTVRDQGTNPFGGSTWTLGYEFSPNVDIQVTSLAFLDVDRDGLTDSHEVAIWDTSGTLLASTSIDNGDPLVGFFRFSRISPLQLTAGNNYIIGGHDFVNDEAIRDDQAVISIIDPNITMIDGGFALPSASISVLTNFYNDPRFFFDTVSFEFTTIPEPTGGSLALFGLAGLLIVSRTRGRVS